MIDHVNNLKLQHLVELSKLEARVPQIAADTERHLANDGVVYGDETIPFVLMPHFVSPKQARRARRAVESLAGVLGRFCDAYLEDGRLREELALPAREDELIRLDPGYPRPLRICRLDAFLHGYDVKFLEFNSDSPAGIGYTDMIYAALSRTVELPRVDAEFETAYEPMLPGLVATLVDAYGHARRRHPDLPERARLAIVDVAGAPTSREFPIVRDAARDVGLDALVATSDELSYDGSLLRAGGEPVHLVYRRALVEDLSDGPLIDACRDGRVVVVNPFRARVANNKKLLALLSDQRFAGLLNADEARVAAATVPWTRVLAPGRASYDEWVVDLLTFVSDNRERLVLKPASDYGGHGVLLGPETDQGSWDAAIEREAPGGEFIVQALVPVPEEMFPIVEDGRVQMRLKRFNINPFAIDGRYAGSITRISDRAVINVSAGGGLLPSVVGRHRRPLLAEGESQYDEEPRDALA